MTKKLLYSLFIVILSVCGYSCSDDNDALGTEVNYNSLPETARSFVSTYFPGAKPRFVRYDSAVNPEGYDLVLTDGTEIEFNAAGEWLKLEAGAGTQLPIGFLPVVTVKYLSDLYPSTPVEEIEREINGYEVDLAGDIELHFSLTGEFLSKS